MAAFTEAALKSEFDNDPAGMGYAAIKASANPDTQLAALLNSLTSPGAANVFRIDVKALEFMNAIVAADLTGLSTNGLLQLLLLINTGILDATNSNIRTIFQTIFAGKTTTLANLSAVAQRTGSRAEVLFGTGFTITPDQCSLAR